MSDAAITPKPDSKRAAALARFDAWQMIAWVLFLVAFIGVGTLPFDTLHGQVRVSDQGPTSSSDTMYLANLGLEDGSARIAESLRSLPAGSRVAVVYRLGTYQTVCAQLICQAAWNHGLRPFEVSVESKDAEEQVRNVGATAAFSLNGEPPGWFPAPQVISPSLSFARFLPQ